MKSIKEIKTDALANLLQKTENALELELVARGQIMSPERITALTRLMEILLNQDTARLR